MPRVIPIDKKLEKKLMLKTACERISYGSVAELMRSGYDVFISNLPRRSAYFGKTRLSKLLKKNIDALPASLDRVPGYVFTSRGKEFSGRRKIARY